jgi:hypothetical protein
MNQGLRSGNPAIIPGKLAVQPESNFRADMFLLFNSLPSLQGNFLYFPELLRGAPRGRA